MQKNATKEEIDFFNPFQLWRNIHTYGSSAYTGPSTLKHTALCSSKKSIWLSRSRHRCSTRYRQTDQFSTALDTPNESIQTDPKMSRDSGQSSRRFSINSIWFINLSRIHVNEQINLVYPQSLRVDSYRRLHYSSLFLRRLVSEVLCSLAQTVRVQCR